MWYHDISINEAIADILIVSQSIEFKQIILIQQSSDLIFSLPLLLCWSIIGQLSIEMTRLPQQHFSPRWPVAMVTSGS